MVDAAPITGAHVLVVDDEPLTASRIAETLTRLGHRPTVCNSWTDAVRIFGSGGVDLVLMDAVMPTVDGFKLTRILRARATTYVPILFLTGLDDQATREHGVEAGADDFLTKPLDTLELKIRLKAMLRIRALTRDLESKTRALARLASVDGLTGVSNRREFDERLPRAVEQARGGGGPLSVLLLDIDHFKMVNDTHGHAVGDQLLALFGRLMGQLTRACDLPFRYGGEEFAILAAQTNPTQANYLAHRIRTAFSLRSREETPCGTQTVSVGICGTEVLDADEPPSSLVIGADKALYRAKHGGRNCVCVYDPSLDGALPGRHDVVRLVHPPAKAG